SSLEHTDLSQPGRTVCAVFRASPLIWPTLSGAYHAPRPLFMVHPRKVSLAGMVVLEEKERATKVAHLDAVTSATVVARSLFWAFYLDAVLVILLSHQTACSSVIGRSGESSPLRAAARQISKGNLDLTRHIAHQQSKLAFGAGRACTKAFQRKKSFTGSPPCAAKSLRSPLSISLQRGLHRGGRASPTSRPPAANHADAGCRRAFPDRLPRTRQSGRIG
ncbi:MAG: hypothetical protein RL145_767, partial [Pseudomonadota bacterium]